MSRPLRIGLAFIAILLIGFVTVAGIFVYTADYNRYKGLIEKAVTDATGRQLAIQGDLTVVMSLPPELSVTDVTLANAPWGSQPQMAHIGQLRVRLRLLPLLMKVLEIKRVRLIDTDLLLETNASGQANWRFSAGADSRTGPGPLHIDVRRVDVEQLDISVRSGEPGSPEDRYRLDTLQLSRSATADSLAVELSGSSNGQPVALSGQTGPLSDLFAGRRFPVMLSGEVAGAMLKLHGGLANALTLEGVDLTIQATGADLATVGKALAVAIPQTDRFDVTAQLSGSAASLALHDARGSAGYKGIELALSGSIGDLEQLDDIQLALKGSGNDLAGLNALTGRTLPQTGPFEVSGTLTGSGRALAFSEAQGSVSHASLKLSLAGRIDDLLALEGIDLKVTGSGDDLAGLNALTGETLPQTGPFEVSGTLTGSGRALALSEAQGSISRASLRLSLTGRVADLLALEGIDLKVTGSGNDLAGLNALTGKTLPQTGPFVVSGRLTGTSGALALSEAQGSVSHAGLKLSLAGRVDDLLALKGIGLDIEGSGGNLGELRSLLGDTLPDTGPFSATAHLSGSAQALAVDKLRASVRQGHARLAVSGKVGDVLQPAGIDLTLECSGSNLEELGSLFNSQLPELGAFRLTGQLRGSDKRLELKNFSAIVDQSDFAGWAKAEFGKRPRITVRLESGLVDFTRIMEQAQGEQKAEAGQSGGFRQVLRSEEPLPFEALDIVDADIAFNARNIKARDAGLEFGQLALRLDAGDLRVDTLEATYEGAKVSANLNLKAGNPSNVVVRFLVQGFDLGRFLREIHVSQDVEGLVDVAADLKSQGNSPYSLLASLDGTAGAVIGKGYVPRFLDLLAQDLSRRVLTIWGEHQQAGELNCGVIQFASKQGVATSEAFLFDTQLAILKGDGEINLATGQLDFILSPKPKDRSLFSLATKLRVDGSILNPRVRPDMTSLATKGAKALSSLVLGPAGLLVPFMSAGAGHKHPCDVAELKNTIHIIYK